MNYIQFSQDADDAAPIGGKARALARASRAGLPVPPWFAISTDAWTSEGSLRAEAKAELAHAIPSLCPNGEMVAVRSSASDEDGADQSFAGQLETFLSVAPADVEARVIDVCRSGFSERVFAYRREHGLTAAPKPPGVLVQRMVAARAAGVAFSADPVSGRRGIAVVTAVKGLGDALVSGEADADTWTIDRRLTIVDRRLKTNSTSPILTDDEIVGIARLARAAARHFERPQDIEWAIDAQGLWLRQARPITSIAALPDPDGLRTIWDNSNIVESYSGVTTPLTFSFAAEIYEHVYRQFCRLMRVPERVIGDNDDTFRNMLGLIRGRLYYNLLNWYRMLALLPGYHSNRRFMEQMMGVRETLPDDVAAEIKSSVPVGTVLDRLHLLSAMVGLVLNYLTLNERVSAFYARLNAALATPDPPLEDRRPDELAAHYRDLRGQLLLRWDAPLVNDFFAMIFYGVLRSLTKKWCGDEEGTLQNDLIGGKGGMVSAEPALRMRELARLARVEPGLVDTLVNGDARAIAAAVAKSPELQRAYAGYLDKFGERTVNELKLESATLHDDPMPLLRGIGNLAQQPDDAQAATTAGEALRAQARERTAKALDGHPVRRVLFQWILKQAQRRVRDRENLRLERTRLFGRVRRIFVELGRRFAALNVLDDPRDIFYLEVDEVLAFVEGRSTLTYLRGLTALRRAEFARYEQEPPPDDRFETRGLAYTAQSHRQQTATQADAGEALQGLGCSPGIVRGPVRLVRDPRTVQLDRKTILVAEHTDPGWIMIFPSALGVLVERGSLLSHAAIVARELGIPAIVSLPGLMHWLNDGEWVELDGRTGRVRKISPESSGA